MSNNYFWTKDEECEEYILGKYKSILDSADYEIIVFLFESEDTELTYEKAFDIDMDGLAGIVFPKEIIKESGGINVTLPGGALYDFLLRMLEKREKCKIVSLNKELENQKDQELYSFLYAYVFRYHINLLQQRRITEDVFLKVCNRMQKNDCLEEFQQYMNFFLNNEDDFYAIAKITAPFLILRGDDTCYGMLQKFADDLADCLACNEQAVIVVGEDESQYDRIPLYFYKGIIGFQTKALEIDFFRNLKGLKFQFWLDYPLHFTNIMRNLPKDYYVLCQDSDYAKQVRDYFGTPNAIQFPPGGTWQSENVLTLEDRPYDIVFMGSYFENCYESLNEIQKKYYNFVLEHPQLTFEKALCEMEQIQEKESYNEEFIKLMRELKPACRAIIGYFREKVICTILEFGYFIHVYGEDWNALETEHKANLIIHPSVSADDSIKEFQKAKIGLNIMSWHKSGMTERIANIMLSGAVCVSDETSFLKENFQNGEEIVLFPIDQPEMAAESIKRVLEENDKRREIVEQGYKKAVREFTWESRAEQLIEMCEN